MSCERCGGLLVVDTLSDLMEEKFSTGIKTVRCLNCGNVEDAIIRANRARIDVRSHCEPRTVGARRLSAMQPHQSEGAVQLDGGIAKSSRGRVPRLPQGPFPANTRTFESTHIERSTTIAEIQRRSA